MEKKHNLIDQKLQDLNDDDIDRRGFLKCMAWAGTGLVWTMSGGIATSRAFARNAASDTQKYGDFSFVQISDSHMGFNKPANPDVVATLQAAIDKINGLATPPDFLLHTGDISHLSRPEQFDTVDQILKSARAKDIFFVPGEHDVLDDNGKSYLERYGKNTQGAGHAPEIQVSRWGLPLITNVLIPDQDIKEIYNRTGPAEDREKDQLYPNSPRALATWPDRHRTPKSTDARSPIGSVPSCCHMNLARTRRSTSPDSTAAPLAMM